jgi:methylated-DNA-[protein]-cysteine S-methyltransferase
MTGMDLQHDQLETPIGPLAIVSDGRRLVACEFVDRETRLLPPLRRRFGEVRLVPHADPLGATSRLRAYFTGELEAFADLETDGGGTPFQERVWAMLRTIPVAVTWSYGELARRLGQPGSSRAVGLANGRNPIGIIVPCHRVIGADGTLTGYGGGIERKRWLLEHEGVILKTESRQAELPV